MDRKEAPVVVGFPLRGEWTVERTPAHRIPSHGTDAFAQRYAYDLIRTDDRPGIHPHPGDRLRRAVFGGRTQGWYAWGQPVHAALGGRVIAAVDGVPEHRWLHPLVETFTVLWNTITFGMAVRRHRRPDPSRVAGNHVIVGSSDVYALYAHLTPGSITVRYGELVEAGRVLGRVGHTGNSTAPHLHFQLMDGADPFTARGLPCAFAAYLVRRGDRWIRVASGEPGRWERIRSVPERSAH